MKGSCGDNALSGGETSGPQADHNCPTRGIFLFPVCCWSFPMAQPNQKPEDSGSH